MTLPPAGLTLRCALALAILCAPSFARPQTPKPTASADATVSSIPGGVVRWTEPGATRCGMRAHIWPAIKGTCYFPVDILDKPASLPVSLFIGQRRLRGHIVVEEHDYGSEDVTLPDIPQANPSPENLRRDEHDRALLNHIFTRPDGPARFTLPLEDPLKPLPQGKSFGVKRIYNGKLAEQAHMGLDYDAADHAPILAAAAGRVVFAKEMFFEGNAVFIDHGDGLVSMYFHLSDIKVHRGELVRRGQTLGREGSTGRSTGPHLWFGVRWHDARIDPHFLLEAPDKIPAVQRATP
jgi:hypothetical protein